jgi:4-alpha-glucanotransferase
MAFPPLASPLTGTAVPLSALRTRAGSGVGEFPDLVPLAQWCRDAGLSLIQLLPINDTGFEPSPYSALSAFALHPVYLRLSDLPGFDAVAEPAHALAAAMNGLDKVDHGAVWGAKLALLRRQFDAVAFTEADAAAWMAERPWAKTYAVFWALRERYGRAGWQQWPEHRTGASVDKLWKTLGREALLPVWLQIHAEAQLAAAVSGLEKLGVALKGDIPILLNEDSADVWAHPEYFDLSLRAGAPPDGMNPGGQNWGFPTYRWDRLAADGYRWWKDRLRHAARFYQAYRIDHVLGFFRIWATPAENHGAELGFYQPGPAISEEALRSIGFDDGRLVWMSEPHIPGHELRGLGAEADVFDRVGDEDLYRFKPTVRGEMDLTSLPVADEAKGKLVGWYRNRTLIRRGTAYYAAAYFRESRAYQTLGGEHDAFERLVGEASARIQTDWEEQGRRLLSFMKDATGMLVCAEDLGSIPDSVPRVLGELGILGLRIVRWARRWNEPGQPYIPVTAYPELSVCTPSVHDTSTLRQWWDEEPGGAEAALGLNRLGPYTPETARTVLTALIRTSSRLCVVALQDWFALDDGLLTADPAQERVNVPGTVGGSNWAWRMKPWLEELLEHPVTAIVRGITASRGAS